MSLKSIVCLILVTLGLILGVMSGHDMFFKDAEHWLAGFDGPSLTVIFVIGVACLVAVIVINIVSGYNYRLSSSVKGPQKQQREYYGPGSDSFNGAYGDRAGGGSDVQSMVRGAFANQVPTNNVAQAPTPRPSQPSAPTPVAVPQRTNDAVDPMAFAQSAETPAGAAASANPLYGGIVEKRTTTNVSSYPGQAGNVNYDPAYGGGRPPQNN